jgi:PAS domain S-box-containing protein
MLWLRSGLLRKFSVIMLALALVPAALLAFQLINISRRGIQSAVLELHTHVAEALADRVDEYYRNSHQKISFALASLQKNMDWSEKQDLLRSLIETHPDIIEISIVDGRGRELVKVYNPDKTSEATLRTRAAERAFLLYKDEGRRVMTVDRENNEPTATIYYPVRAGVAARIHLSLATLGGRIGASRFGGTGFAVVVDDTGRPLLYPSDRLSKEESAVFPRWSIVTAALQAQSLGSSEFSDEHGHWFVGAYAPVATGGAVVTLQSRDEAFYAANVMKRTAIGAVLLVVLLGFLAGIWQARALTRPIIALSRAAEAVSRGDFLAKVEISTGDELQDLAETFNRMTAQLRAYSVLQVDRLIAEQRKTEAILYSSEDGILLLDREGRVQLANRSALEMFSLPSGASVDGRKMEEVLPLGPLREAAISSAREPKADAFRDVALDAGMPERKRYLRVTAHPVRRPNQGGDIGIVVSVRDVTLEREIEKMKEEFLHYITHDLRNPLGSAIGFLDILLRGTPGVLNPDQHSIVSSIKRSTMRLMSMVNNILDIAKMESGRIRLQLKEVSITGIAGRSIGILESLSKAKKINVVLDASEEFSIQADGDLVERIFTNLIGNAIKYTPQEGTITVSIEDRGASLRCCVADTGEGIPENYREKIFQKFEQVQGQRRGGTGLGLTISKFFVEAHFGEIWVESEVGKGSRFYFTIPKTLAAEPDGSVSVGEKVA